MKRRRGNQGPEPRTLDVDLSGLSRSKRRKLERPGKKGKRQTHQVKGGKSVIKKEMERICQKLNIIPKPAEENEPAESTRNQKPPPKQPSRKEMERTRKQNLLRDNKEEDKVIKQLEKKLFLNKRKNKNMPRSFIDEGLDYILELTDQKYKDAALAKEAALMGVDRTGRRPGEKLGAGRKGFEKDRETASYDEGSESEADGGSEDATDDSDGDGTDEEDPSDRETKRKPGRSIPLRKISEKSRDTASESDDGDGSESEDGRSGKAAETKNVTTKEKRKVRFDVPDVDDEDTDGEGSEESSAEEAEEDGTWEDIYGRLRDREGNVVAGKYVPPSRRAVSDEPTAEKKEQLARLKKQLKGLLNRLSETTVQSIGLQMEELYRKFSNYDVNSTLVSSLCDALVAPFATPERLAMEHAMLVAYLHCNVASEVGAYVLENMMKKFHSHYENISDEGSGKEADNCILFVSYLFAFKVVHSRLIFDVIRKLAESFGDRDVELILLVLRSVGFGLRKHDPAALKEVVLLLQQKSLQDADRVQEWSHTRHY